MKILVIGCGSIGKRHIGNFKPKVEVIAWNRSAERLDEVSSKFGIKTSLNLELLFKNESLMYVLFVLHRLYT